jgi:chromatin remodeling complex protein RSC6
MAAKKSTTSKKPAAKKTATKRKPNAAFMKELKPSKELAEVVGAKDLPRTEVVKKLWAYIRKNGLQDAKEKRMINADDKLRAVFGGKKQVSMFEMTKLVSKHLG